MRSNLQRFSVEDMAGLVLLTGHETQGRDDDVPGGDFEQLLPRSAGLAVEPDLLQDDILVQVDAVESKWNVIIRNVQPMLSTNAMSRRNQHMQVPISILAWRHSEK